MRNKKLIYKIFSYLIVLTIFFFLGKIFFENWQKIKDYDFSFNYFYLIISFLFLFMVIISFGLIWNKILRILEPIKKLSNFKAIKIYIYSSFGKYIPGKAWAFVGLIYLGQKEGLSKKKLVISSIYEAILFIISAFLFSALLLSLSLGARLFNFYFIPLIFALISFILIHPKIFYNVVNFILRKFKRTELSSEYFLNYRYIIKIIFYFFIICCLNGLSFFFLVKSIVSLPFYDIIGLSGIFVLASSFGIIAIFAPSGLGVKEGTLTVFLQVYFPLSIAVVISLIARIWTTLGEIIIFSAVYLYSKFKKL